MLSPEKDDNNNAENYLEEGMAHIFLKSLLTERLLTQNLPQLQSKKKKSVTKHLSYTFLYMKSIKMQ